MDRQPVLEGERLLLRPLTEGDWDGLFAVASNPGVWEFHPCTDRCEEPVFRMFFEDALVKGGALAVTDKATGEIIGSSRFQGHDPEKSVVEIGWSFLARPRWGQGYNAEMKRLMLAHALRFVECVTFRVGEDNILSRRAMTKIGGMLTDRVEMVEYRGLQLPHVIFEITRENFANGPLAGA